MTPKILAISFLLLIATSCIKDSDSFYNIEQLNVEIKKEINVDLQVIKAKIDSHYKTDSSFYVESMYEVGNGGESKFYKLLGLIQTNSIGDSIPGMDVELYKKKMLKALKKSVRIKTCKNSNDSICIWKRNVINWINRSTESDQVSIQHYQFAEDFYRLYRDGYLSKDEFDFLTVYLYVLASIDAIDNSKPEFYKKNGCNMSHT